MYETFIFDLDGTLLQTLPDIRLAINEALKRCGYSYSFSLKEARALIGNGADMLVKRALKEKGDDPEAFAELKAAYMPLYRDYQNLHAKPFNGMKEVLTFLKERGLQLFVATNKPNALAQFIVEDHFGKGLFTAIEGHEEGEPVKPDPLIVNRFVEKYGIDKSKSLFIGDSYVDVDTAQNAGVKSCLVTWGYGFYKKALLERADYVISKPKQLAALAFGREA